MGCGRQDNGIGIGHNGPWETGQWYICRPQWAVEDRTMDHNGIGMVLQHIGLVVRMSVFGYRG